MCVCVINNKRYGYLILDYINWKYCYMSWDRQDSYRWPILSYNKNQEKKNEGLLLGISDLSLAP